MSIVHGDRPTRLRKLSGNDGPQSSGCASDKGHLHLDLPSTVVAELFTIQTPILPPAMSASAYLFIPSFSRSIVSATAPTINLLPEGSSRLQFPRLVHCIIRKLESCRESVLDLSYHLQCSLAEL